MLDAAMNSTKPFALKVKGMYRYEYIPNYADRAGQYRVGT